MLFLLGTLALGLTTFTLALRAFWPFTVDDAFINLRYGRNLLEGHGPVFNVGERAEGYTSFAWMLAAAAAIALAGAPEAWMKIASLLATLAAIGLAAALAAEVARPRGALARWRAATFTAALLLVYPGTAVHAVAGLETSSMRPRASCFGS